MSVFENQDGGIGERFGIGVGAGGGEVWLGVVGVRLGGVGRNVGIGSGAAAVEDGGATLIVRVRVGRGSAVVDIYGVRHGHCVHEWIVVGWAVRRMGLV